MLPGLLRGAGAALLTPLWLRGDRWRTLMDPAPGGAAAAAAADPAILNSRRALRLLARLPGGVWRNTCLYRSVAECLVLRQHGVPARLRIGVGHGDGAQEIVAHAWVLRPGEQDEAADARAATLRLLEGGG